MNFNISGAAVYFRIPTGIPILGRDAGRTGTEFRKK